MYMYKIITSQGSTHTGQEWLAPTILFYHHS